MMRRRSLRASGLAALLLLVLLLAVATVPRVAASSSADDEPLSSSAMVEAMASSSGVHEASSSAAVSSSASDEVVSSSALDLSSSTSLAPSSSATDLMSSSATDAAVSSSADAGSSSVDVAPSSSAAAASSSASLEVSSSAADVVASSSAAVSSAEAAMSSSSTEVSSAEAAASSSASDASSADAALSSSASEASSTDATPQSSSTASAATDSSSSVDAWSSSSSTGAASASSGSAQASSSTSSMAMSSSAAFVAANCSASAAPSPAHGNAGTCADGTADGEECSIACDTGYSVYGHATLYCSNGRYLRYQECRGVGCTAYTGRVVNGTTGSCGASVASGSRCSFTCNSGYVVTGSSLLCTGSNLTGTPQTCEPIACYHPAQVASDLAAAQDVCGCDSAASCGVIACTTMKLDATCTAAITPVLACNGQRGSNSVIDGLVQARTSCVAGLASDVVRMRFNVTSVRPITAADWNTLVLSIRTSLQSAIATVLASLSLSVSVARFRVNTLTPVATTHTSSASTFVLFADSTTVNSTVYRAVVDLLPPSDATDPLAAITVWSLIASQATSPSSPLYGIVRVSSSGSVLPSLSGFGGASGEGQDSPFPYDLNAASTPCAMPSLLAVAVAMAATALALPSL